MLSHPTKSRTYRCTRCLLSFGVPPIEENPIACPACGNNRIVSGQYFNLIASLLVVTSYVGSFALVYLLSRDLTQFMLPALEGSFILLLVSACLVFPQLPLSLKPRVAPKKIRRYLHRSFLLPRH